MKKRDLHPSVLQLSGFVSYLWRQRMTWWPPAVASCLLSLSLLSSNNSNLLYCLRIHKFKPASLSLMTIRSPDVTASAFLSGETIRYFGSNTVEEKSGGERLVISHSQAILASPLLLAPSLPSKSNKANHSILICPFPLHYIKLATDGMHGLMLQNSPVPTLFHQAGS